MKAKYKVVLSLENKNNAYTPIQVIDVRLCCDRRKHRPYNHLRVKINLVHGTAEVESPHKDRLAVLPFSPSHIRIDRI